MVIDDQKRVVVIDDDLRILKEIEIVVQSVHTFKFVHAYDNVEAGIRALRKDMPDIVVINPDINENGFKNLSKIKRFNPRILVLALLTTNENASVINCFKSGANGVVLKTDGMIEVLNHLQVLVQFGVTISKSCLKSVISPYQRAFFSPLSDRETEILELFAAGKSYTMIAADLNVSGLTIKSHMKNIFSKLRVSSKAEAIKYAKENHLISTI